MNDLNQNIEKLNSNDINIVIIGLNKINQLTFERSTLSTNELGNLIISIFSLLDIINPIPLHLDQHVQTIWYLDSSLSQNIQNDVVSCSQNENLILIIALNIVRNLSQESNNEYLLASCPKLLKHFVSIIHFASFGDNFSISNQEVFSITFEILSNIINKADFHNRLKSSFDLFNTNKEKEDLQLMIHPYFSTISTNYYNTYNSLLQILHFNLMKSSCNRVLLIRCLELFIKICQVIENVTLFLNCPISFIDRLIQLLETSNSYNASVGNYHVELQDPEIRDLVVELIYLLCVGSTNMLQVRFAQNSRILKVLFLSIKGCRAEKSAYRNSESTLRMISIFNFLISKRESKLNGFQNEMLLEAFTDSDFLDLTLNSNLNEEFINSFLPKTKKMSSELILE